MHISLDCHEDPDLDTTLNRRSIQPSIEKKSTGNKSIDESITKPKSKDDSVRIFNELENISTDESAIICERILLKLGFQKVNITAISKGTYIEGDCIFEKNPFLWLNVMFRLDRNENSIDSKTVRCFRTAMRDRADKGILMTTNTFTMDAKWEAAREGVLPILLIDRYKLIKMINKL